MIFSKTIPFYEQNRDGSFMKYMLTVNDNYELDNMDMLEVVGLSDEDWFYESPKDASKHADTGFIVQYFGQNELQVFLLNTDNLVITSHFSDFDSNIKDVLAQIKELEHTAIPVKYKGEPNFTPEAVTPLGETFKITPSILELLEKSSPFIVEHECMSGRTNLLYDGKSLFESHLTVFNSEEILDEYKAYKVLKLLHDDEILCCVGYSTPYSNKLLFAASIQDKEIVFDVIGSVNCSTKRSIDSILKANKGSLLSFTLKPSTFEIEDVNGLIIKEDDDYDWSLEGMTKVVKETIRKNLNTLQTGTSDEIKDRVEKIEKDEKDVDELGLARRLIPTYVEVTDQLLDIRNFLINRSTEIEVHV